MKLTSDQEYWLLKAYDAVNVTVWWGKGGQPVRNLVWLRLAKIVKEVEVPGKYPSSPTQTHWTYRLTEADSAEAKRIRVAQRKQRAA
jgi:hypothetical protein